MVARRGGWLPISREEVGEGMPGGWSAPGAPKQYTMPKEYAYTKSSWHVILVTNILFQGERCWKALAQSLSALYGMRCLAGFHSVDGSRRRAVL